MKRVVRLRECCSEQSQMTVENNVLKNVKILGFDSQNRRRYTQQAAQQAVSLYEGCKSNLDHPEGNPASSRRIKERFGWLQNVRVDDQGVWGDLAFNPKKAIAEEIRWWAENRPDAIGLSHNAIGQGETRNGIFVVEKIVSVRSVDVVADPASTRGLYEARMDELDDLDTDLGDAGDLDDETGEGDWKAHLLDAIKKVLTDEGIDPDKQLKVAQAILNVVKGNHGPDDGEGGDLDADLETEDEEEECEDDMPPKKKKTEEAKKRKASPDTDEVKNLREELDKLKAKDAVRERAERAHKLCEELRLPKPARTAIFLEQLVNAPTDKAMKALIEDRKQAVSFQSPKSSLPGNGSGSNMDNKAFAKAVRNGVN